MAAATSFYFKTTIKLQSVMKTNKFWSIVAIVAMVASMAIFASCEKDPQPTPTPTPGPGPDPVNPPEVVDEGTGSISSSVVTNSAGDTLGIGISYTSWIKIQKDGEEKMVEVTLNNLLGNVDTTVYVDDFDFGDCQTNISYQKRGERVEGAVTIIDSALIYTVNCGNTVFEYVMTYETAVYDDGTTRAVMPSHQLRNVRNSGAPVITTIESDDDGTNAYTRRQINHSIVVNLGQDYTLDAKVKARKFLQPLSQGAYIKMSSLVSSNLEVVNGVLNSSITVHYRWSNGNESDETYTYAMEVTVGGFPTDEDAIIIFEGVELNSPTFVSSDVATTSHDLVDVGHIYVEAEQYVSRMNLHYDLFNTWADFVYNKYRYNDGVMQCDFPFPDNGLQIGISSEGRGDVRSVVLEDGRDCSYYVYVIQLLAGFEEGDRVSVYISYAVGFCE